MAEYLFRRRHRPEWLAGKVPPDTELAASGFQPSKVPARRWAQYGVLLLATLAVDEPLPEGRVHFSVPPIVRSITSVARTWPANYPAEAPVVEALPEGRIEFQGRAPTRPTFNPFLFPGPPGPDNVLPPEGAIAFPARVQSRPFPDALRTWLATLPPFAPDALPEGSVRTYGRHDMRPRIVPVARIGGGAGADQEAPVGRGLAHVPIFPKRTAASAFTILPGPVPAETQDPPEGRTKLPDRIEPRHITALRTWVVVHPLPTPISLEPLPEGTVRFYGRADMRPRVVPVVRIGGGVGDAGIASQMPAGRGFVQVPPRPRRFRVPVLPTRLPDDAFVPTDPASRGLPALAVVFGRRVGSAHSWVAGYPPDETVVVGEDLPEGLGSQTVFARGARRLFGLPLLIGRSPFEGAENPPTFGLLPVRARGQARLYGQPVLLAHVPFEEAEIPAGMGYIEVQWGGWLGAQRAAASAYWTLPIFVPPDDFVPDLVPPAFPVGGEIRGSRWDDITGQVWEDIRGSRWLDAI